MTGGRFSRQIQLSMPFSVVSDSDDFDRFFDVESNGDF